MVSLAETMEPHGRDGPVEEFMEDLIRGENERIDITQVFLNESGEGDESVGRREPAEEEVERGLYPSDDGEDANGSGDDDGEADSSGHEESDGDGEAHGDGEAEVWCMHMYISTIPPLLCIYTC
jgi:hypothetical protein